MVGSLIMFWLKPSIGEAITYIQWNLSITALRIKDTSVIRTPIDGPKRSAIETYTVKRHFYARVLFMRIMRVKRRSHKFVVHKFLSRHTLQCMKRWSA